MAITKIEALQHVCDGCGKVVNTDASIGDPPHGITLSVIEVNGMGGQEHKLWACRRTCVARAVRALP